MKLVIIGDGELARQIAEMAATIPDNIVVTIPAASFLAGTTQVTSMGQALWGADWILDVTGLPVEAKRFLFAELNNSAPTGAVLSTDESMVPMRELFGALATDRVCAITHIFAPPSRMRLAEVVAGPTEFERVAKLCEVGLGRKVVQVPDAPGFIANRMGFYWLALVMCEAQRNHLSPAQADAVAAEVSGGPLGAFALADLIGLDTVLDLDAQLRARLPEDDPLHGLKIDDHGLLTHLVASGAVGRASRQGFYRRNSMGEREAIDPRTLAYEPVPAKPMAIGRAFAAMLERSLDSYACSLSATTHTPIATIAAIMALGYGWTCGSRWSTLRAS